MPLHLSSVMAPLSWAQSLRGGERREGQAGRVADHPSTQGLASSEQTRRVTGWRREKRWEMVELKDRQQQKTEDRLQCDHTRWPRFQFLAGSRCTFTSLKVRNWKVHT